jgi:uncharacterized protein (TIGR02147 family)
MDLVKTEQTDIDSAGGKLVKPEPPHIFLYVDFRQYLKDFYTFKQDSDRGSLRPYSYANFAAAADIKSPNYLRLIIEGKRNLSDDMVHKFSKALGHTRLERDEFTLLVHYGQSRNPEERIKHLKALSEFRIARQLQNGEISATPFETVPDWLGWFIFAMADQKDVKYNVKDIGEKLLARVGEKEIQDSLNRLINAGLIEKDEDGNLKKSRTLMEHAQDVVPQLVRKIQGELIYLGMESLLRDEANEREFGAVTLALTKEEFESVKFEIRKLRKKISKDISSARNQSKGDRVYQLNFQLFPVTKG